MIPRPPPGGWLFIGEPGVFEGGRQPLLDFTNEVLRPPTVRLAWGLTPFSHREPETCPTICAESVIAYAVQIRRARAAWERQRLHLGHPELLGVPA
jgi:hypothetical protein